MNYEYKLGDWQGPLDKLLELIEERKMDITAVSLAAVTDDFLKHLENLRAELAPGGAPEEDMRLLADFIVVASRLILIKSKSLLPDLALTAEEEGDIRDLEHRLFLYKKLKDALKNVQKAWQGPRHSVGRPYFMNLSNAVPVFYPGTNLDKANLLEALTRIYESLQKFVLETKTIEETILSLEEKMQDIVRRMEAATNTTLHNLSGGSKADIIVAFLAVLHLAREQLIFLEQQTAFSDIIVRKNGANTPSSALETHESN